MTNRTEVWIHVVEPDDTNKIASPSYIKSLLGIDNIENRISEINKVIDVLEKPMRKQKILHVLSDGKPHTGVFIKRRLADYRFLDLLELKDEGHIKLEMHGTQYCYRIVAK